MKHTNTPQENLLGLIALAAEHAQHGRYSYAVTALAVAMDMARMLAGEEGRCPVHGLKTVGGYCPSLTCSYSPPPDAGAGG